MAWTLHDSVKVTLQHKLEMNFCGRLHGGSNGKESEIEPNESRMAIELANRDLGFHRSKKELICVSSAKGISNRSAESSVYVIAMFKLAKTYVFFMHGTPLLRGRVCDSIPFESEFLLALA